MVETEEETSGRKQPGLGVALVPLLAMGVLLAVGYGVYAIKAQVLLIAAASVAGLTGWWLGWTWQEMQEGIVDSIRKAMPAILIMLCVGLLVGSWIACGTIPMVMYYGLAILSPKFFLVTACLVCCRHVARHRDLVGHDRHPGRGVHRHRPGPGDPARAGRRRDRGRRLLRRQDVAVLGHPEPRADRRRRQPVRQHPAHDLVGRAGLSAGSRRLRSWWACATVGAR